MLNLNQLAGFGAYTRASAPPVAASSIIASIQPFSITISGTSSTATISSVDTSRSVIVYGGFTTPEYLTSGRNWFSRLEADQRHHGDGLS